MSSHSKSKRFSVTHAAPLWSFAELSQASSSLFQQESNDDNDRNKARKNSNLAEDLQKQGDCIGAIEKIKAALDDEPSNAVYLYQYARLLLMTNKIDEGIAQLLRVLSINPAHINAHDDLWAVYLQKDDTAQALEHLLVAITINKKNYNAVKNLLSLLIHLERYDDAIATLRGLLTDSQDDPEFLKIAEQFIPLLNNDTGPPLDGNGERIDLIYRKDINFDDLDVYQKSHYRRYEFAASLLSHDGVCGDFACGTGYGAIMLSQQSQRVYAADINSDVVKAITARYKDTSSVEFMCANILDLSYVSFFDTIVSFETIEHLEESDIPRLFNVFHNALKSGGKLVFSTPFMQERSDVAIKMGFHRTFYIDEKRVEKWLADAGFHAEFYRYQNYTTHTVSECLPQKDFIICVARKDGARLTPFKTRKSLEQENDTLRQAIEVMERSLSNIQTEIGKYLLLPKQGLTFAEDLLFTYHNADFTKNRLFAETYDIIKKVDDGHLLKGEDIRWRIHVLCWAAYHAQRLEGNFVDCGVNTGLYARGVMHFIDFQKLNKKYYLLDTFAGLDPKYSSPGEMQRNEQIGYGRNIGIYEAVVETFAGFNVEIIKGPVPETLSQVNTEKVCYLSIDMNCVIPEIAALEFFWDKMVSGGIIVIDDYGYPGHLEQKEAHDAFAKSKNVLILSLPTCQGLIVKP